MNDLFNTKNIIKKVTKVIPENIIYKPNTYNIPDKYKGTGVKICIIDSGFPKHKDIKINGEKISLCEKSRENMIKQDTPLSCRE